MNLRIKEHRKSKGWTLEQLSDVSGISRSFLSQIENEKRQPSVETLTILADCFKVSVPDLYEPDAEGPSLHGMLDGIKSLSEKNRQMVNDLIQALLDKQDGQ